MFAIPQTGLKGAQARAINNFNKDINGAFDDAGFGGDNLTTFMEDLVLDDIDPLVSISKFGSKLMDISEGIAFSIIIASLGLTAVIAWNSCLTPGFALAFQIYGLVMSVVMFFVMLWTVGALLGFMVPMIPYLIYSITALSWFVAVAESIVAAPILALGLVLPQGEELGKAAAGIQVLANVFLRPMLMVLGFAIASTMVVAVINMINFGFQPAVRALVSAGGMEGGFLVSLILPLIMYTGIVLAFINKSFALIYVIPDKILRWIGVAPDSTDEAKIMQEVQGKYDQGSTAAGDSIKGAAAGAQSQATKAADKAADNSNREMGAGAGAKSGPTESKPPAPPSGSSAEKT
jgi:conjugal transfer/type IV secretion protein DotA/TraY